MDWFVYTLRQVTRFDARRVLPIAAFLLVYLALGHGAPWGISGFVWATVTLCVMTAWVRLPVRRRILDGHEQSATLTRALWLAIVLIVAMQLTQNDPVFSQRLWTVALTGLAAGYLAFYLLARDSVDKLPLPWRRNRAAHSVVLPIEILRLLSFAVLNEVVIAEGDMGLWVTVRALTPILLTPVVRWLTLLLLIAKEVERAR